MSRFSNQCVSIFLRTHEDRSTVTACVSLSPLTCEKMAGCWCGGALWAPALLWWIPSSSSERCPAGSARTCLLEHPPRAAGSQSGAAFLSFPPYLRDPPEGAVPVAQCLAVTARTQGAAAACRWWACTGSRSATPWRLDHRWHTCTGMGIKLTHVTVDLSSPWVCVDAVLPQQGGQYVPNDVFLRAEWGWRHLSWRIQVWGFSFLRIQRLKIPLKDVIRRALVHEL